VNPTLTHKENNMGSKRTLDYAELVVDGDMSGDITSASTNILHTDRVGYQLVWTGTPVGTFSVEVSNDDTTWAELTLSTEITGGGAADNAFIDVETAAKFVRVKWTNSSSTGTLQAHITAKSISG
jgi:hypothetical protein